MQNSSSDFDPQWGWLCLVKTMPGGSPLTALQRSTGSIISFVVIMLQSKVNAVHRAQPKPALQMDVTASRIQWMYAVERRRNPQSRSVL
jgi:hypothetical protein